METCLELLEEARLSAVALDPEISAIRRLLSDRDIAIAFGGPFSSGKSSLLNALTGVDILPVKDLPETGVICKLRGGSEQSSATLVEKRATHEIPFTSEAIQNVVSLREANGSGRANAKIASIQSLNLDLESDAIPQGVVWMDAPGIDDSPEMEERAREAMRHADIVVWIFNSKQFLAMSEKVLLSELLEERGRHGVLFVLNTFLRADTSEEWDRFHREAYPAYQTRFHEFWSELDLPGDAPEMLPVSARSITKTEEFGARSLREALEEVSSNESQALLDTKMKRTRRLLEPLKERFGKSIDANEDQLQAINKQLVQLEKNLTKSKKAFLSEAGQRLNSLQARLNDIVVAVASQLSSSVTSVTYSKDYSKVLADSVQTKCRVATDKAIEDISAAARRYALERKDGWTQRIRTMLSISTPSFETPNKDISSNTLRNATIAGLAFGSVVPVVGTLFGGFAGFVAGVVKGAVDSSNQDVSELKRKIMQAGNKAENEIPRLHKPVLPFLDSAFSPDTSELESLIEERDAFIAILGQMREFVSMLTDACNDCICNGC